MISEPIDADAELRPFMEGYTPRAKKIMMHGYGVKVLRSFINGINISINSKNPYQGTYYSWSGSAESVALFEYSMGYPLDRVRYFLQMSAKAMLICLKLRGTLETVEFVTERGVFEKPETEKLLEVNASVDVSMGSPASGIESAYCAWLAHDWDLAVENLKAISFDPYDVECNGEARVSEYKAHIHLLLGNEQQAKSYLDQSDRDEPTSLALQGILEKNQAVFTHGLMELVEAHQHEAESEHCARAKEALHKEGKKDIALIPQWSIWGMGLSLLAIKNGLELQMDHPYIPKELLDGCL